MDLAKYQSMLRRVTRSFTRVQYGLDVNTSIRTDIDEMSLLFLHEKDLETFLMFAQEDRTVDHFNSVLRDTMVRQFEDSPEPGMVRDPQSFDVRFEFLRLEGCTWRIEAMCVLGGTAPLHSAALRERGDGCVIHASFKTADEQQYRDACLGLTEATDGMAAEYRNSYGLFSYWRVPEIGDVWLKPRVNLRD